MMKKRILVLCLLAVLLCSALVFALKGLNKEQKAFYNKCNRNCSFTKVQETRNCNTVSYACMRTCKEVRNNCTELFVLEYDNCHEGCKNLTFDGNLTKRETDRLRGECRRNCSREKWNETRTCYKNQVSCDQACQGSKNQCKKDTNEHFLVCKERCVNESYVNNTDFNQAGNNTNETNSTNGTETEHNENLKKFFCNRPRPNVCIDQYLPVCSNGHKTYSNGCTACMDKKVAWYTAGACKSH